MLGVLVNALAILTGSFVGLLAKKGIPEKITNAIMTAIALCVIYIGVSGMLKGENTLVLIVSMVPPWGRFWISTAASSVLAAVLSTGSSAAGSARPSQRAS